MEIELIMPTIEIILLEVHERIKIKKGEYPFAVQQEFNLISHRDLFRSFLEDKKGTILHLGNLDLQNESYFFGGDLIDWDFDEEKRDDMVYFKFEKSYIEGIKNILLKSYKLSPIHKICFLTDIQCSTSKPDFITLSSIDEFWDIHNSMGLRWNTLYTIQ